MNVVNMDDMYYKSIYSGSQALDALERCFELQLNRKYYRPSDLNKIVKKYSKQKSHTTFQKNESARLSLE